MKKVSFCIGCYNEEENVEELYNQLTDIMSKLPQYDYEIIFEDNNSTDETQNILKKLAEKDKKLKLIFNIRNFGIARSGRNCVYNASGDVIISLAADLQDPPELIPEMLKYWEEGYLLVLGQKVSSEENGIKYNLRKLYYKIIKMCSETPQLEQYSGYGAIDKSVYEQIKACEERTMSFRHLIPELGYQYKILPYTQKERKHGKSSFNLWRSFDFSITSLVDTSKFPIRIATIIGCVGVFIFSIREILLLGTSLFKRKDAQHFNIRTKNENLLISFLQIFFIGIIGEYIFEILDKNRKRPLVIEKERINF